MKGLILRTDGSREVRVIKDAELADAVEYMPDIDTRVERLPHMRGYRRPGDEGQFERFLSCWVDEEGMMKQLPSNPYAVLLMALNVYVSPPSIVYGNVVVFSRNQSGKECQIDPYVVQLLDEYDRCEDEDAFFCALEERNQIDKVKIDFDEKAPLGDQETKKKKRRSDPVKKKKKTTKKQKKSDL